MGPSLVGSLGPAWGHLEASEAHRKRKGEKAEHIDFPWYLKDFGHLEGAVEGSKGTWNRLGDILGPLGGMSEAILTHLGVAWAILEATLDALSLALEFDLDKPWQGTWLRVYTPRACPLPRTPQSMWQIIGVTLWLRVYCTSRQLDG